MAFEFFTKRTIEFADTDMAGIVHFSRFFVFMETAETEFLESIDVLRAFLQKGSALLMPRVSAECDFQHPAKFGDVLDVHTMIKRKGRTSLTYRHIFQKDGRIIAKGEVTSVCCRKDGSGKIHSAPIPESISSKIEEAPL